MTDQEIQKAMMENRSDYIASRQIKGRMDDIPPIVGVVVDHPEDRVIVNVPVYFSPSGYVCGECNNFMASENPRDGKIKIFCTCLICSQNLITKIVDLPFCSDYVCEVDPSAV